VDAVLSLTFSIGLPIASGTALFKLLKNRRKEQFEKKMMLGDRYSGNYVFINDFGEPWWDTAIRVNIKRIVETIRSDGLEMNHFAPQTLRHTFATRRLENDVDFTVKKQIMGIEPTSPAWEASVLPMNHICMTF